MSEQVTLASTTDSQEAVEAALESVEGDHIVPPEEQGFESPVNVAPVGSHGGVASSTDPQEVVEEIAKDMREEHEFRGDEKMGRTRRKMAATISRLHEKVSQLTEQLGGRKPPAPVNGEALEQPTEPPANGEARQGPSPGELQRQHQWEAAQLEARVALPYKLQMGQQKYADFNESIDSVSNDHPLPAWTMEALKLMPNTADVMYWLSKHSDHMDELLRLDRAGQGPQAMRLLDQISGGLAIGELHTAPRKPPRFGHRAPEPVEHVRGGSAVTHRALDDPSVSYAEFKRRRESGEGR
jgi:hypothetical protein